MTMKFEPNTACILMFIPMLFLLDVETHRVPGQLQMPDCIVTLEPSVSEASYNS